MTDTKTAGLESRTTVEAPPFDKSDDADCDVCEMRPAEGFDARTYENVCSLCARLRCDGGEVVNEPSLAELTAFKRDVLWSLSHESDQKGTEILRALSEYYGQQLNHSRLYPVLDDLDDAGFVKKSERDGRTNNYRLTEQGEAALDRRVSWQDGGDAE